MDNDTIQLDGPFIARCDRVLAVSFFLLFLLSLISVVTDLIQERRIRPDGIRPPPR
jgi:hypothetical protein